MASAFNNSPYRPFVTTFDASVSSATNDNDLTHLYNVVKFTAATNNSVDLSTTATDTIAGVIQNYTAGVGGECTVALRNAQGTYKVKAGGTIAVGDLLTTDSASHAITTTTTGNIVFGQAFQSAVAGDVFEFRPHAETHS
jgi:hypothetical protein